MSDHTFPPLITIEPTNSSEFDNDVLSDSTPLKLLLVAMYSAIFLVGSSGNALVVAIIAKNKSLQSPTNIFIANLALSDVLMCLLAVPFTPLNGMVSSWVLGEPLCRLVAMSSALSVHVSTQTSTAIAIDRYFAIVHPFKARLTAKQCLIVIALVWTLSLTFSLPLALYQQVEKIKDTSDYTCNENWPDIKLVRIFTLASLSLQYLLPCSVISVCYSRVYSALNRRSRNKRFLRQRRNFSADKTVGVKVAATVGTGCLQKSADGDVPANGSANNVNNQQQQQCITTNTADGPRTTTNNTTNNTTTPTTTTTTTTKSQHPSRANVVMATKESQELRRKRRTTNMLIAMVAIFVCCWLPLNVIMLTFDYAEDSLESWPYRLLIFFLAHVIAMSSTVYNPFLYAGLNEAFREEFKKILPLFLFSCLTCHVTCFDCRKSKSGGADGGTHGGGVKVAKQLGMTPIQAPITTQPTPPNNHLLKEHSIIVITTAVTSHVTTAPVGAKSALAYNACATPDAITESGRESKTKVKPEIAEHVTSPPVVIDAPAVATVTALLPVGLK